MNLLHQRGDITRREAEKIMTMAKIIIETLVLVLFNNWTNQRAIFISMEKR